MHAARLSSSGRRPRRGSLERPLDARLVRNAAVVVLLPLLLAAFTVGRPGALAAPVLPPSFDGAAAAALTRELAGLHPSRVPGSAGNAAAAEWFAEKMALYGLPGERDTWEEEVPGLGVRQLANAAAVVEGESPAAILLVSHHDNSGRGPGASDDASGVAALVELARSYAVGETSGDRVRPVHTLVFLSADAGAYGGLGARRFATASRFRDAILAAVVLDGLGGPGEPRLELAGPGPRAPAPPLVRTASVRIGEQLGSEPGQPGLLRQLVDLGIPFAYGGQAPLLGAGVAAVRVTTADDSGASEPSDRVGGLDRELLGRLGRGVQSLLGSLDAGVEVTQGTAPYLYLGGRVVRGWALALVLVAALVPFAVGVADLVTRCRRRAIPLAPGFRSLAGRLALALWAGALLLAAAAAGALAGGPALPPPPFAEEVRSWPLAAAAVVAALVALPWLAARRLAPRGRPPSAEDELAATAAALVGLLAVSALTAAASPYSLLFVLPSLYAWLWLPQATAPWARDALFGLGLAGPVLALVSLGSRFGLGADTPLYAATLVTTGYVPWTTAALALAWTAVAVQLGAVVAGLYAPPAGPARVRVARALARAQASRR